MCQSGLCKDEKGCGENVGDCTFYFLRDEEIDEYLNNLEVLKFSSIKISKKKGRFRILELT